VTRPVCYAGVVWLTSRRMGGYTITIELTQTGFVLRANPESASAHSPFGAFYGGQTGLITCDRSGKPAAPGGEKMYANPRCAGAQRMRARLQIACRPQ